LGFSLLFLLNDDRIISGPDGDAFHLFLHTRSIGRIGTQKVGPHSWKTGPQCGIAENAPR
jgi:hypothetical protein